MNVAGIGLLARTLKLDRRLIQARSGGFPVIIHSVFNHINYQQAEGILRFSRELIG